MKKILIEESVFKTEVLFIYNCSPKEVNDYLKKTGKAIDIRDYLNFIGTLYKTPQEVYRIVYVEKYKKNADWLSVLAHEILHLVIEICNDKGVPIYTNLDNAERLDETACYLMEFYMSEFIKKAK